jgi:hypothetical protein
MRKSNNAAEKGGADKGSERGKEPLSVEPGKAGDEPFDQVGGVRHDRHTTDLWLQMRLFKEDADYKSVTLP